MSINVGCHQSLCDVLQVLPCKAPFDKCQTEKKLKWPLKHREFVALHELPEDEPKWSSQHRLHGVSAARDVSSIDICWSWMRKKHPEWSADDLARHLCIDLSQCVTRQPWTMGVRSLVQHSTLYLYGQDRVLSGREHFNLLGSPLRDLKCDLYDRHFKELAGEAFGAPCVATCLIGLALAIKE